MGLGYRADYGGHDDLHFHVPAGQGKTAGLQQQGGTGMTRQLQATEAMIHALVAIRTQFDLRSIKHHVDGKHQVGGKNRAVIRWRVEWMGGDGRGGRQNGHHYQ